MVYILATAAAAFVYIFHILSATWVLNSFEDLCITLAAADKIEKVYKWLNKKTVLQIQSILFL